MKWRWIILIALAVVFAGGLYGVLCSNAAGPNAVAETRQALRQQGLKTDLAEFDFSSADEMRARVAALTNVNLTHTALNRIEYVRRAWLQEGRPELMESVGPDSAIVVWKQAKLWSSSGADLWPLLREMLGACREEMDTACAAPFGKDWVARRPDSGFPAGMHDRLRATAVECATAAGRLLLQHFGHVRDIRVKGSQSSVVTEADVAAEQLILRRIRDQFPDHNIIAEETGFQERGSAFTWVVDPLDGTSNFAAGLPWFGVMVSVLERGSPILAAMYLPTEDQLYLGERGCGATRNGSPVRVTSEIRWPHLLCAYGLDASPDVERVRRQGLLLGGLVQLARNVRATSSLVDFAGTIDGRLGACVNFNTKIWDIAAPALLLPEAGGQLTDLRGEPIRFTISPDWVQQSYAVVGGSPSLCRQVLALIASSSLA